MNLKNNLIIVIVAAVLFIVGIIGFFLTLDRGNESVSVVEETGGSPLIIDSGKEAEKNSTSEEVAAVGEFKIEEGGGVGGISTETLPGVPVPDLNRPIIFNAGSFTERIKQEITAQIEEHVANLKQDNGVFNNWMDLALAWKSIGEYEGAREAWEYAGLLRPLNSLSFSNLGVLYGYYLGNPSEAEKNFLQAIQNEPKNPYHYLKVIDFYNEVVKDEGKAKQIREKAASQGLTLE